MTVTSDRPLRVGLDLRLAAYRTAGIARYAVELGHALARLGGVDVVPLRHARDVVTDENEVRLRTPPHHRFEERLLRLELRLRRASFDLYHATDFIAPDLGETPAVATVHDLAFLRWPEHLSADALAYYRRIEASKQYTRRWITPSTWTRDELCEQLDIPEDKVEVIPHGVPSYIATVGVVPRGERRPFFVAVGTVEPRKRYDLLLDALERIHPRPELLIAGQPGWNTDALQHRLRTTPGVTWLRNASDQEIRRLLAGAVALAMPSQAEGFGFPALEAMACGTPVISSGYGALAEVTGTAAIVPPQDDAEGWAEALSTILEDSFRWEQASRAGAARAMEFSWERAAEKTLEVYRAAVQ